ncbi:MAG: UV DNA damage repair endonuclease UvsE [Candidatus Woesearchaeota archaeon]
MKLGYPCINTNIGCTANSTFRLASYSKQRLLGTVQRNLDCLQKILEWNVEHGFLFFRIGSPLVPLASHPVCKVNWTAHFKQKFKRIGNYIKRNKIRVSMHPDQFTLINSIDLKILKKSIAELAYHCKVLDALGLDSSAKIQIHVGGVYGDKKKSMQRFIEHYKKLPAMIKKRLVIENDHVSYSLKDCLEISRQTGIPVVFDAYHHECLNNGENFRNAVQQAKKTWKKKDGKLMVDYSTGKKGKKGSHADHIEINGFRNFLKETKGIDFDIMLEIKDKEKSAIKALAEVKKLK